MADKKDKNMILVVDDTIDNIDLLSNMLSPHYKVKAATHGEKAIKIAQTEPRPDIILLDIMMPGMSGYEVCEELKLDPATQAIPVIFITAKTETEDEQRGFELGAVDYITKPFNPVIVEARIRSQLSVYAESKKLHQENIKLKNQIAGGFQDFSENDLRQLGSTGESDRVEFKSTLRCNLHTGKADKKMENACLKTIAAFLNSDGGVLLVGVDDDGHALGLTKDNFTNEDKQLLHWNNLVKSHLGVEYAQFIRAGMKDLDGERILLIQSLASPRPVFFARDNEEIFYVRAGNATQQLKPSEVLAYVDQRS
jgi:CheY-like chemotaxis protein